jgi:GPH family glycoside/pentoside/hexuronide:cation symporter
MSPPAPAAATAPEDRVPLPQKIAYGLGTANDMWGSWLYPSIVWPVYNIFLHVSPSLVSLALMINRLADVVADPLIGWWSDNTRSRWGRRRPFILAGSVLAGLLLPALFLVQPGWSERAYFTYMAVSSAVYICVVAVFNIPYQSLGNELTPDYHERTVVFSFKNALQKVAEVGTFFAATFVTLSMFNDASGRPDILRGAQVYTMILGGIMILVGIIVFAVVKERYYDKLVTKQTEQVKLTEGIWKCLRCRPFRAQIAMALAYGLGTSMVGALGYYLTVYYVCRGDVALGSKWNFGMGLASMVFGLAGIPVWARIARHLGKRTAMLAVQCAAILVFAGSWWLYNPEIPWIQLFAAGLIAFTQGGFWMLYGSMGPDVIDCDELETGKRREGAFTACGTWIMKVGLALGIGCSGFILDRTGFHAELGGDQAPEAIRNIRLLFAAIPIGGLLLAMFALARFGLTPARVGEIRAQLETRRGKV